MKKYISLAMIISYSTCLLTSSAEAMNYSTNRHDPELLIPIDYHHAKTLAEQSSAQESEKTFLKEKMIAPIQTYNEILSTITEKTHAAIAPHLTIDILPWLLFQDYNNPKNRLTIYKILSEDYPSLIKGQPNLPIVHSIGYKLRTLNSIFSKALTKQPEASLISDQHLNELSDTYNLFTPISEMIKRKRDSLHALNKRIQIWNALIIMSPEHKMETQEKYSREYLKLAIQVNPDIGAWELQMNLKFSKQKELPKSIGKEVEEE